jgi:DGQHR domain-containing protein
MSDTTRSAKFAERIRVLLKNLKLVAVDGGEQNQKLTIGGTQIDAIAGTPKGLGSTLFVIEAKSARKEQEVDLKAHIRAARGARMDIEEGLKKGDIQGSTPAKIRDYKGYKRLVQATIGENYLIKPKDLDALKTYRKAGVHMFAFTNDWIEFYEGEWKKIGELAKYSMLGEINVRLDNPKDRITAPALMVEHGPVKWKVSGEPTLGSGWKTAEGDGIVRYQFSLNPKEILQFATVARREHGGQAAYQRSMDPKRIKAIAKYVAGKENFLPNSIILAFEKEVNNHIGFKVEFKATPVEQFKAFRAQSQKVLGTPDLSAGKITFPREFRCCWVVDGQHRLYAFAQPEAKKANIQVPVIAFQNLSDTAQANMFMDINENQKPVSPDLVWDLRGQLTPNSPEGIISRIVKQLEAGTETKPGVIQKGPLFNRIQIPSRMPGSQSGKLKLGNICKAIKDQKLTGFFRDKHGKTADNGLLPGGGANPLHKPTSDPSIDGTVEMIIKHLNTYYGRMEKLFPDDWKQGKKGFVLGNSTGNSMLWIFTEIISHAMRLSKTKDTALAKLTTNFYDTYLTPLQGHMKSLNANTDEGRRLMRDAKDSTTGEGGKRNYAVKLIKIIRDSTKDKRFGGDNFDTEYTRYKELEARCTEVLYRTLGNTTDNQWLKTECGEGVWNKAKGRAEATLGEDQYYTRLTMGECNEIFRKFKGKFYPLFIKSAPNSEGFAGQDTERKVDTALGEVNAKWQELKHDKTSQNYDPKDVERYIETIESCVDNILDDSNP